MKCKGCGAEIVWIKVYLSSKKMPVDAKTVQIMFGAGRNIFITSDGYIVNGKEIEEDFDYDAYPDGKIMEVYKSHFATCPAAGKFRKGGGK